MATLTVGPGQEYQTINAAVTAAAAGDTIDVSAGTYTNDFVTIDKNLTLESVGGTVDMVATTDPPDGKAIIDEGGAGVSVSISGFDISGAVVPDNNGAAIRYEGGSLTLSNVDIHNNQEGLLGAADPNGQITITDSTFKDNGAGDGYSHNIYVGAIDTFDISGSTVDAANVGHDIKSRAANTTITNNYIEDGPTGNSSYEIDLPNGGNAVITGNVIEKGPDAQNPNAISFGEEGNLYASTSLDVENNTIVSDDTRSGTTAVVNDSGIAATISGNTFWGWTNSSSGPVNPGTNNYPATEPSTIECFCAGTKILTASGETAVEDLAVGTSLVARHAGAAPAIWVGHRRVDCRRHPRPENVWPVRVQRGAFGPDLPHRDLLLSPGHGVLQGGVLIGIRDLINGSTIVQEPCDEVSYWHVEMAQHDIIHAEGLPVETYLDTGNRAAFANGGGAVQLHPDFVRGVYDAKSCARLILPGAECDAAKRLLLDRAAALGFATTLDPAMHLLVDGRPLWPRILGTTRFFDLPPRPQHIRLITRSAVPAWMADGDDHRSLGVAVASIRADGEYIPLTDPRLTEGWHGVEGEGGGTWRWTNGDAGLRVAGTRCLAIAVAGTYTYWPDQPVGADRQQVA